VRALALSLLLVGCAAKRPSTANDVNVAAVTAPPLQQLVAPRPCGPEHEIGTLDLDDAFGQIVRSICIRGVDEKMQADVRAYLHVRPGQHLDAETTKRDLESLYESDFFRRINVMARKHDDGIELTFDMELRPPILALELAGAEHLPENDEIRLTLAQGKRYSPAVAQREVAALQDRYRAGAYPNATTELQATREGSEGVRLRVVIHEQ
jgi:outer membrane protein assembly factor BamA